MRLARLGNNIVYVEDLSWQAPVFRDRLEAGSILGEVLAATLPVNARGRMFGLVAGGVPVAYAAVRRLHPRFCLDLLVVKKITYPWTTEAGFGAVAPDGSVVYDRLEAERLGEDYVKSKIVEVRRYVVERTARVRGSAEYTPLNGETAVVVDDGIATGFTMLAALRFLRRLGAGMLVAAAPTASVDGAQLVAEEADLVVVVNLRSGPGFAVAQAYLHWYDVPDEEVVEYATRAVEEGVACPDLAKSVAATR